MKFKLLFVAASVCVAAASLSCPVLAASAGPEMSTTLATVEVRPRMSPAVPDAASNDARYALQWVAGNSDNQNMPFVIVDKKAAQMFVFEADGRLINSTPVLLGAGMGDASVPGIGTRDIASLRTDEKTTPAGRFISEPGRNLKGEDIVWVDYDAKIAIHRLRPDTALQARTERLASGDADAKRVSAGCIVVPVAFYENVVRPVLGKRRGLVYVLPENRPVQSMFGAYDLSLSQR